MNGLLIDSLKRQSERVVNSDFETEPSHDRIIVMFYEKQSRRMNGLLIDDLKDRAVV